MEYKINSSEDKISLLMDEFDLLLKKHEIEEVVLFNHDDGQLGYYQLGKIAEYDNKKNLLLVFSGKGITICPCCSEKEHMETS